MIWRRMGGFVGIKEIGGLTQISFYHAKHGTLEASAALFHTSVSQGEGRGSSLLGQRRLDQVEPLAPPVVGRRPRHEDADRIEVHGLLIFIAPDRGKAPYRSDL